MDARDAFRTKFLARCVEEGLDDAAILKRAEDALSMLKSASITGLLSTMLGKSVDVAKGAVGGAVGYGLPLALAAPPIIGGIGGYGLARATDIDDTDVAEIKDNEVLDQYKRETAKLRRLKAVKDYRLLNQAPTRFSR